MADRHVLAGDAAALDLSALLGDTIMAGYRGRIGARSFARVGKRFRFACDSEGGRLDGTRTRRRLLDMLRILSHTCNTSDRRSTPP
jgi:hypothetical protein